MVGAIYNMIEKGKRSAKFHLPGLFEFFEFYKVFLPLFYERRNYFYDWVEIASIYGSPMDCIWSGGRLEYSDVVASEVLALLQKYGISARLTFSNSLLQEKHLLDRKCNDYCRQFEEWNKVQNGVIVHSDLLLEYLKENYPGLYLVSSTTKVLTQFHDFVMEVKRGDFTYVVPDFRLNKQFEQFELLSDEEKEKVEFLCNECCSYRCKERKACYENVSRKILEEQCTDHVCNSPEAKEGYRFSKAMQNPMFISVEDIKDCYLPRGFSNFKVEGRSLGSALILEMLLYYMVKPEFQLVVREEIYLDNMLNLF